MPHSKKSQEAGARTPTRTEKVQLALRRAILEQRLTPGTRLPEDAIGEAFGASRTIAREALGRLATEGLVELIPNRGAFVANPSTWKPSVWRESSTSTSPVWRAIRCCNATSSRSSRAALWS